MVHMTGLYSEAACRYILQDYIYKIALNYFPLIKNVCGWKGSSILCDFAAVLCSFCDRNCCSITVGKVLAMGRQYWPKYQVLTAWLLVMIRAVARWVCTRNAWEEVPLVLLYVYSTTRRKSGANFTKKNKSSMTWMEIAREFASCTR